jgi:dihydrolipoamide dehydrogenase
VGCIPSKALLQSSENYEHAGKHFADHGIAVQGLSIDIQKMLARKDAGREAEQRRHPVPVQEEQGHLLPRPRRLRQGRRDGYEIQVGDETVVGKHVIVATGSNPRALPGVPFDEDKVLSNDGALAHPGGPEGSWC